MGRVSAETKQIKFFCFETVFIVGFMLHGVCPWIIGSTIYFQRLLQDHGSDEINRCWLHIENLYLFFYYLCTCSNEVYVTKFLFHSQKDAQLGVSYIKLELHLPLFTAVGISINSPYFKVGCRPVWTIYGSFFQWEQCNSVLTLFRFIPTLIKTFLTRESNQWWKKDSDPSLK